MRNRMLTKKKKSTAVGGRQSTERRVCSRFRNQVWRNDILKKPRNQVNVSSQRILGGRGKKIQLGPLITYHYRFSVSLKH